MVTDHTIYYLSLHQTVAVTDPNSVARWLCSIAAGSFEVDLVAIGIELFSKSVADAAVVVAIIAWEAMDFAVLSSCTLPPQR